MRPGPLARPRPHLGTIRGTLTVNEAAKGVETDIESAEFHNAGSTECSSWNGGFSFNFNPATNGMPWCLSATEANDKVKLRGASCTAEPRPIRIVLAFTSSLIGPCTYQRTAAAEGTLATGTGELSIVGQEWTKLEGGSGCVTSMRLDASVSRSRPKKVPSAGLTFASR